MSNLCLAVQTNPSPPAKSIWHSVVLALTYVIVAVFVAPTPARAQCTPTWLELTGLPGFDNSINAIGVLNDGTGDALYAGGNFTIAGGDTALRVAKFDGTRWTPLGDGFNAQAYAGTVFNGQIYACGDFTTSGATSVKRVARWTGTAWQAVGPGFDNGSVYQLFVFNNELYAAGSFTLSGGFDCFRVAKWNGSTWQQVGAGFDNSAYCLASYQGQLYAGGIFANSGVAPASNIARFDGTNWQPVAGGVSGGSSVRGVYSMLEFNSSLHIAGGFTSVNGAAGTYAARWNGTTWTAMPFPTGSASNGARSLAVFNNELYCGGTMAVTGGVYLARWNGTAWVSVLASIFNTPSGVTSLASFNGNLFIGGLFQRLNANAYNRIARYDGTAFRQVGTGFDSFINAVAEFNSELVIGGRFITGGGQPLFHVVRFDGMQYRPMGNELLGDSSAFETNDFCIHNNELHAAGAWTLGGGTNRVARWNGTAWTALAVQPTGTPDCIASFNGDLIVGGFNVNGTGVNIARFNGSAWVPMGNGLNNEVRDLLVFNNSLYACGDFGASGATPMSFVARWDGTQWNVVGGSTTAPGTAQRGSKMAVYNNQLVLAGNIPTLAGVTVNGIARLVGNTWTPFDQGFISGNATAITVLNDSLIACGSVRPPGTAAATWVSLWNGSTWSPIGQNFSGFLNGASSNSTIACAIPFQNELFIGGDFFKAGGRVSSFLAHWGSEPPCIQSHPGNVNSCAGANVQMHAVVTGVPPLSYQWRKGGTALSDGPTTGGSTISGTHTATLVIANVNGSDDAMYDLVVTNTFGSATSNAARVQICVADMDDGSGTGTCDGGVTIDDLLYYIGIFADGVTRADIDDGSSTGTPDGGVTIDDLLYFLLRFDGGC